MIKTKIKTKKGNGVGIAIILMAVLLLLGSVFVDDDNNSKINYLDKKDSQNNDVDSNYPEETYLFFLNSTVLGRQDKVTNSFPNIELGSRTEYNIVYLENDFRLKANPFTSNEYSFSVSFENPKEVDGLYLYFDLNKLSGEQDILINVGGKQIQTQAKPSQIPIIVNGGIGNNSIMTISFKGIKPKWYEVFNWNSFEVKNLKVVEIRKNKNNDERKYNFDVDKDNLERMEVNVVVDCSKEMEANSPIQVYLNGYTIADFNPDCDKYINKQTISVEPLNIIKSNKNEISFKTKGYYNLAYSFNYIYYNDKDTYKFTIGSFNDIIDIIMYGDFDKEVIDLKINSRTMSLRRDEIVSIIEYIRYGTNTVEFLTKPVDIEEFIIEKNEFNY